MEKKHLIYIAVTILLVISILTGCSTTKALGEGESRLASNIVTVTNSKQYPEFNPSGVDKYIRQKPNSYIFKGKKGGWNPAIYIYNWDTGKCKWWDNIVHKIGQEPVVFRPDMVEESKGNITTYLENQGYYYSQVTDSISIKNRKAVVYYNITLGKQYPIKSISYDIEDPQLLPDVMADTLNSLIKVGMPLSESLLDKETERSAEYLKNKGYYEFSKNYYFFRADTISVKDSVMLKVIIKNHTRKELSDEDRPHRKFYFGDVYIYPVSDNLRYRASIAQKIPQIYDTVHYENISILYDKKRRIRPSILYTMNLIEPGALYSSDIVNLSYRRLANLRVYSSVNLELTKVDTNVVDVMIRLLPSKIHGYKVNLEASTNSSGLIGISPAISYFNRNIFNGGEWLSLSVMGNFQFSVTSPTRAIEFGANAGLSFPTFVLLPDRMFRRIVPRTDIALSYNYQKRPEYTRNMIGGKFGWNWSSSSNKFYYQITPLQLNIVNLPVYSTEFMESLTDPFVREAYKNHFDMGLGFNFQYASVPGMLPSDNCFKASLQVDISGNLLSAFNKFMAVDSSGFHTIWDSPYSQFVRGELSLSYTWMLGKEKKHSIAVRALGGIGYAYGNSTKMPFERLFWGGGSNSLRGWTGRGVGPGSSKLDNTFSIPNQTGDMRLEANVEYRFPIFSAVKGAIFFDWGNVWNLDRNADHSSMAGSTLDEDSLFRWSTFLTTSSLSGGLGLRLDLNFILIRVDYGIKLYDPVVRSWKVPGEWFKRGGASFQFGIGYPF